jgi:polyhydroxybutyrate depolymerase
MMTTRALTRICLLMTALSPPWSAAAAPSVGCGKALASGIYQMTDQSITRTYRVFVPSRYQPGAAYPLVIVFHGWGGDENESLGDEKVRTLSDERGYIVVASRGLGSAAPDSNRNTCSWTQCQADDVAFTLALVHEIESKLCVDTGRVFASGGISVR